MTRFLLLLLVLGLLALAVVGAGLAAIRGERPAILSRRLPAIA
jgi:VIT1/CCC1 family predicted Fe2+/Mn2+ transporter